MQTDPDDGRIRKPRSGEPSSTGNRGMAVYGANRGNKRVARLLMHSGVRGRDRWTGKDVWVGEVGARSDVESGGAPAGGLDRPRSVHEVGRGD
jgi:hypothetical protein